MIVPTFLLTTGLIDDLLTKKVHNALAAVLFAVALAYSLFLGQILTGVLGLATAAGIFFPLFALRVLGAGDAKLMMAFGLATSPDAVVLVTLYGLIWGSIFGVTKILLSQNWKALGQLTSYVASGFHFRMTSLNSIPMTFPLLLGWLTYAHLKGIGL